MSEDKKKVIDYKDPDTLKTFISENGKINSSRYTRLTAKEQRKLKLIEMNLLLLLQNFYSPRFNIHRASRYS